jgi:hypothetical protein
MAAPASAAHVAAASVLASRSAGGRPVMAPRKYLREMASSSGRPEGLQAIELAQDRDRLRGRLGEIGAGVEDQLLEGDAVVEREVDPLAQEGLDVGRDVVVVGERLALGLGARVHEHEGRAGARRELGQPGVAQPADVVEHHRPGLQGRARHLGLPRVDRDGDPLAARRATSGTMRAASSPASAAGV